jgi:tRNA(Arg) A34 adenosine deaminase TadA
METFKQHAAGAKLIWAATTPVWDRDNLQQISDRTERVTKRNKIAAEIMKERGIPTNDLFGLVEEHPEWFSGDGVHFNSKGKAAQGAAVAESVLKCLRDNSGRTDSQDPMPADPGDETMSDLDHERYMRRTIKLAGNVPSVPFGALIVDRRTGKIVAEGWNKSSANPTWHGEIDAINQLAESQEEYEGEDLVLYTTAEPCPMCQGAILWSGIETVVYGTSIRLLQSQGWRQIDILAEEVVRRSPSWKRAPFDNRDTRLEILKQITALPGIDWPEKAVDKYPNFPMAVLTDSSNRQKFVDVLDWIMEKIKAV